MGDEINSKKDEDIVIEERGGEEEDEKLTKIGNSKKRRRVIVEDDDDDEADIKEEAPQSFIEDESIEDDGDDDFDGMYTTPLEVAQKHPTWPTLISNCECADPDTCEACRRFNEMWFILSEKTYDDAE